MKYLQITLLSILFLSLVSSGVVVQNECEEEEPVEEEEDCDYPEEEEEECDIPYEEEECEGPPTPTPVKSV